MNNLHFKWWMLAIPGVVFVLVLLIILLNLPQPQPVSTESTATPAPTISSMENSPKGNTDLKNLNKQIVDFKIDDPLLASPNYDTNIALPKE
jgi:hypothetical protein